jgi:hypothetical protein
MDEAGATSAFLYVLGPQGPTLTASAGDEDPPPVITKEISGLGSGDAAHSGSSAPAALRIRTVSAEEMTYELMLLPRRKGQSQMTILALGHAPEQHSHDLPESVLEKLSAWATD